MHPYRTPAAAQPANAVIEDDGGLRLAFRVMTLLGAVQLAVTALQPSWQTLFGAACFAAGVVWLVRHRRR